MCENENENEFHDISEQNGSRDASLGEAALLQMQGLIQKGTESIHEVVKKRLRRTTVRWQCGAVPRRQEGHLADGGRARLTAIVDASEPSPCEYNIILHTELLC